MSSKHDRSSSVSCAKFEPQTWRKDRCKRCFRLEHQHGGTDDNSAVPKVEKASSKEEGAEAPKPQLGGFSGRGRPRAESVDSATTADSKLLVDVSKLRTSTDEKEGNTKQSTGSSPNKLPVDLDKSNANARPTSTLKGDSETRTGGGEKTENLARPLRNDDIPVSSSPCKEPQANTSAKIDTRGSTSAGSTVANAKQTVQDGARQQVPVVTSPSKPEGEGGTTSMSRSTGPQKSSGKDALKSGNTTIDSSSQKSSTAGEKQLDRPADKTGGKVKAVGASKPVDPGTKSTADSSSTSGSAKVAGKYVQDDTDVDLDSIQKNLERYRQELNEPPGREKNLDRITKGLALLKQERTSPEASPGPARALSASKRSPSPTGLKSKPISVKTKDLKQEDSDSTSPESPGNIGLSLDSTIIIESTKFKNGKLGEKGAKVPANPRAGVKETDLDAALATQQAKERLHAEREAKGKGRKEDIDLTYVGDLEDDLFELEDKCDALEKENRTLKRELSETELKQDDSQKRLEHLRMRYEQVEEKKALLEEENRLLSEQMSSSGPGRFSPDSDRPRDTIEMEDKLKETELVCEILKEENEELRNEIEEMRLEMEEMHDHFRDEEEAIAFRELQKELEITAKNCRILQFKLRKSERKNEQIENERQDYEDKVRKMEAQFQSADDKLHIRELEEELRMAKEVSVRLHDELEFVEDKRTKFEDENARLNERLKMSDNERVTLENQLERLRNDMDRLRADLIEQNADARSDITITGGPTISITQPDELGDLPGGLRPRAPSLTSGSRQSSTEHDIAQLMRDLSDSKERELDMKDQLRFAEEEIKVTRKKLQELEEENESIVLQLRKMSSANRKPKHSPASETETSDSEAEIDPKIQMELAEQEMNVLRRKMAEVEKQNESLGKEMTILQQRLTEKEREVFDLLQGEGGNTLARRTTALNQEIEQLKWKLIEKDREIDRLSRLARTTKNPQAKLKKSRSLDSDTVDLKRQLELVSREAAVLQEKLRQLEDENEKLTSDNNKLLLIAKKRVPLMTVDDPRVENCVLKDKMEYLQMENARLKDNLKNAQGSSNGGDSAEAVPLEDRKAEESQAKEKLRSAQEEIALLRKRVTEAEKEHSTFLDKIRKRREKAKNLHNLDMNELKDEIEELDDEISELRQIVKAKDDANNRMERDLEDAKEKCDDLELKFKKKEKNLLEEIMMLDQKNDILSNLLEAARTPSDAESSSSVTSFFASERRSTIDRSPSIPSDVSVGSDDVFNAEMDAKSREEAEIQRKFKMRINYLEKLLEEERSKADLTPPVSPAATSTPTDDLAKEKEVLQKELNSCRRQLTDANKQVQHLNERLSRVQLTHESIRGDFESVTQELEYERHRRKELDKVKMAEDVVQKKEREELLKRLETYKKKTEDLYGELRKLQSNMERHRGELQADEKSREEFQRQIELGREETAHYKQQTDELKTKLHEAAQSVSSKDYGWQRQKSELEMKVKSVEDQLFTKDDIIGRKVELLEQKELIIRQKDSTISAKDETITQKDQLLRQKEDIIRKYEGSTKQRENEMQKLRDQVSQRDSSIKQQEDRIRQYGDLMRQRDDRLREKDDILHTLNLKLQNKEKELSDKEQSLKSMNEKINEKEQDIKRLQTRVIEKRRVTFGDDLKQQQIDLEHKVDVLTAERDRAVSESKAMRDQRGAQEREMKRIQMEAQQLRDKLRIHEISRTFGDSKAVRTLVDEKEKLLKEKSRLQMEIQAMTSHRGMDKDKLETILQEKENLLHETKDLNDRLQMEIRMLNTKLEDTKLALTDANDREDHLSNQISKMEQNAKVERESLEKRLSRDEKLYEIEATAMRANHNSRINSLQTEINRLQSYVNQLTSSDQLKHSLIDELETSLLIVRKKYNDDCEDWELEKSDLLRKLKQVDHRRKDIQGHLKQIEELKCSITEAEGRYNDLRNNYTADKNKWENEKLELQAKINQLEELMKIPKEQPNKFKELKQKLQKHTRQELQMEKERAEHKRLLSEAQELANNLQEQLRISETKRSNEKRDLIMKHSQRQLDWESEREDLEIRVTELETRARQFAFLNAKYLELERKYRIDQEGWRHEKNTLLAYMEQTKEQLVTERAKLDEVVCEIKKVRDLAPVVEEMQKEEEKVKESVETEKIYDEKKEEIRSIMKGKAISREKPRDPEKESFQLKKTLDERFLSQVVKALSQLLQLSEGITTYHEKIQKTPIEPPPLRRAPSTDSTDSFGIVAGFPLHRNPSFETTSLKITGSSGSFEYDLTGPPYYGLTQPAARPFAHMYLSGTQSAHGSRSATPERSGRRGVSSSPVRKITNYPEPPPSFIITPTHSRTSSIESDVGTIPVGYNRRVGSFESSLSGVPKPVLLPAFGSHRSRPALKKCYSLDTPGDQNQIWRTPELSRAGSTDSTDYRQNYSQGSGMSLDRQDSGVSSDSAMRGRSVSTERLAVDNARKRFFQSNGAPEPIQEVAHESKRDSGFMSWPERKKHEVLQPESVNKEHRVESKERSEAKEPEKKPEDKSKEKDKDKSLVSKGSFRARFSRTPKSPKTKRAEKSKSDKDLSKSADSKKVEEKSKDSKGKGKGKQDEKKKVETKGKTEDETKDAKGKTKTLFTKPSKPILFGSVRDKTKWFLQRTKSTELEPPKDPAPSTSARKWSIPDSGSKVSSGSAEASSSGSGKSQQANGNQEKSQTDMSENPAVSHALHETICNLGINAQAPWRSPPLRNWQPDETLIVIREEQFSTYNVWQFSETGVT
ncbi:major antigen-like isoform X2 [Lineus longissimus]|uniref:major antigen-like isoform X2 n=1 Tax=Lineus longissimus TaxID=88925 RepID=UPI00315D2F2D